ncbi:thioesterase II family protein [Streptomyces sp. NPDC001404]|uniref:thioesterase II family protein n=1 Tax=Streptomyces sp. NPDC001404 TaxID=3364571 RepID=UPI00368CC7E5
MPGINHSQWRDPVRLVENPPVLCLLHHAGGSAALYTHWQPHFPAHWSVHCLELPDRARPDNRAAPLSTPGQLAKRLLEKIPNGDGPLALFGHSMGAVVACEVAQQLVQRGRPPAWIGLSSCAAPQVLSTRDHLHELSDTELRAALHSLGGTPKEVLNDLELWESFGPAIRRDLKAAETWQGPSTRIDVPFSVFGGCDDQNTPPSHLHGWERHLGTFLGVRIYPGDHFYLTAWADLLVQQIQLDLLTSTRPHT